MISEREIVSKTAAIKLAGKKAVDKHLENISSDAFILQKNRGVYI